MNTQTQFTEILFPDRLQPDDLTIIEEPDTDHLGRAQLNRAVIGNSHQLAPNSRPLESWTGARIGFVADASLLELPAFDCYWLETEEINEPQ